jgi:hypothetical protein
MPRKLRTALPPTSILVAVALAESSGAPARKFATQQVPPPGFE